MAIATESFPLYCFYAASQPDLPVLGLIYCKISQWNYLGPTQVLHEKFVSFPAYRIDSSIPLEAPEFFTLSLTQTEFRAHARSKKMNRYEGADITQSLTQNYARLTLATSVPEIFFTNVDSPRLCGSRRPPAPATDSHSLCLICGIPSTHTCLECDQHFCGTHLYTCGDCNAQCCGDCLDAHRSNGHWGDSDTAAEQAHTHHASRASHCRLLDLRVLDPVTNNQSNRRSSWLTLLLALRSLPALFFPRLTASPSGACL